MKHVTTPALVGGLLVALAASATHAQLAHRYSFTDAANPGLDSVGGANGTLNGTATVTGGQLVTTGEGGSASRLNLPLSAFAGITGSFTIEQFVTVNADAGDFTTLFSVASDQNNFLLVNPRRGSATGNLTTNFRQAPDGEESFGTDGVTSPIGTQFTYAVVYDAAAGTGGVATAYLNGVPIGTDTGGSIDGFNLEAVAAGGLNGIGGNAPFPDPSLSGSTNEFRIYNGALSAVTIAASAAAGPDVLVPEPATLGLAAAGIGMALRRRRA